MIIKLTINDNDFNDYIDYYFKSFHKYMTSTNEHPIFTLGEASSDDKIGVIKQLDKVDKLLNPNVSPKWNEKDGDYYCIINRVRESFLWYLQNSRGFNLCESETAYEYVKSKLEVTILTTITDADENGETWYWMQHSNTVINQ